MKLTIKSLAATTLLLAPFAQANHFYIGLETTGSVIDYKSSDYAIDGQNYDVDKSAFGLGATLGYRYSQWLSLEAGASYTYSNPITETIYNTVTLGSTSVRTRNFLDLETNIYSFSLAPKFTLPLNTKLNLFAKPSIHYTITDADVYYSGSRSIYDSGIFLDSDSKSTNASNKEKYFHGAVELGTDFNITKNFGMKFSYQYLFDGVQFSSDEKLDQQTFKVGVFWFM